MIISPLCRRADYTYAIISAPLFLIRAISRLMPLSPLRCCFERLSIILR